MKKRKDLQSETKNKGGTPPDSINERFFLGMYLLTVAAAGSSAFAIIVPLLGLLNNDYLRGITFLTYHDVRVLYYV
jgi:hypothetical protein